MTLHATFTPSRAKLARASEHIAQLEETLADYFSDNPVKAETSVVVDANGRQGSQIRIDPKPLPMRVRAILGDIVHCIRSSLDGAASEMAELRGKNPRSVYFPFAVDESSLDQAIQNKNFHFCGKDAVAILKSIKPYKGGNDDLRALHDLDIIDKHSGIIPQLSFQAAIKLKPVAMNDGSLQMGFPQDALNSFQFSFPAGLSLADRPLIQASEDLVQLCEGILEAFAAVDLSGK